MSVQPMGSEYTLEASLLLATYNQAAFLRRTLIGLCRQTDTRFEVIICDDGSGPEVPPVIEEFGNRLPGPISHFRQEDRGFRKCRILNEGVLRASADYLIFLDADCIPHRRFVAEHLRGRRQSRYLAGRRVELDAETTRRLRDRDIENGSLERILRWGLPAALAGRIRHLEAGLYVPPALRALSPERQLPLLGCNFSCWKRDLVAINGFNEDFTTPAGGEDSDIERRLRMLGLRSRSVKHSAVCYHQYHPPAPRREEGVDLYRRLAGEGRMRCDRGLDEHSAAPDGHERRLEQQPETQLDLAGLERRGEGEGLGREE